MTDPAPSMISPPAEFPPAELLPALRVTASAAIFEESKAPLMVMSPESVDMDKAPSACVVPMASALEFTNVTSPPEEMETTPAKLLPAFDSATEAVLLANLLVTVAAPPTERAAPEPRIEPFALIERLPAIVLDESWTDPVAEGAALVTVSEPAVTAPRLMAPDVELVFPAPLRRSTVTAPRPALIATVLITAAPASRY